MVFRPGGVVTQPEMPRDGGKRLGVARGVLAQVEAHQGHSEGRDAPLQIEQPAPRLQAVTGLLERAAAEGEGLGQLFNGHQRRHRAALAPFEPVFDRAQRRRQLLAHLTQQQAIRLVGVAHACDELVAARLHRQLEAQRVDLAQVQAGGLPAREQADGRGDRRGHRRVAVAIAADPGAEGERGLIGRQPAAGVLDQRGVERPEKLRHRVPQRLFEDRHARSRFVDRRWPPLPHLAGFPRSGNLDAQRVEQLVVLGRRQVGAIALVEQVRDAFELLHQRPARDLGRVRREDQLDAQAADGLVQAVRGDAGGDQPAERLVTRPDLRRRALVALVVAAASDAMVLLGDVGQVEEVREGARHGQGLVDRHLLEDARQRGEVRVAAAARLLGQRAHALDQLENRLALVATERLAQQFTQQPDVVSECLR